MEIKLEKRGSMIMTLSKVFNFIEDLADEENSKLALYIKTMGYDENEPVIVKAETKIQELRKKAEEIQDVINVLMDGDDDAD